jgi:hypothetical protein
MGQEYLQATVPAAPQQDPGTRAPRFVGRQSPSSPGYLKTAGRESNKPWVPLSASGGLEANDTALAAVG